MGRWTLAGTLLLVMGLLVACGRPVKEEEVGGSVLFVDGQVVTGKMQAPEPVNLLVEKGRLVRMLSPDDEVPTGVEVTVDLAGGVVLPGLTDAHGHVEGFGRSLAQLDLRNLVLDEIVKKVQRAAREENGGSGWILGRGWDQTLWGSYGFPGRQTLDEVAPDRPVLLRRVDGHAVWLNGEALRRAGIEAATPDPAGGRIVRDERGDPTGVLVDRAVDLVDAVVPVPDRETIRRHLQLATERLVSLGLTAIHDAGTEPEVLAVLEEMAEAGELPLRVEAYLSGDADSNWLEQQFQRGPRTIGVDDRLRVIGLKLYADGALGSRGALLLEDYSDEPGNHGLAVNPMERLAEQARAACRAGFQVAIHAIGDGANRSILDLFGELRSEFPGAPRFRIEHAQILHPSDIGRFAQLGVVASMQPIHATSDMRWALDRLGEGRLGGAYAWNDLRRSGAVIAAGSDAPVESPDPRLGLHAAVTRQDLSGWPAGGWRAEQRLSVSEAVDLYTVGAALASHQETERGRIAEGFRADFTILDRSPAEVAAEDLPGLGIRMTVVGGEVVFR